MPKCAIVNAHWLQNVMVHEDFMSNCKCAERKIYKNIDDLNTKIVVILFEKEIKGNIT